MFDLILIRKSSRIRWWKFHWNGKSLIIALCCFTNTQFWVELHIPDVKLWNMSKGIPSVVKLNNSRLYVSCSYSTFTVFSILCFIPISHFYRVVHRSFPLGFSLFWRCLCLAYSISVTWINWVLLLFLTSIAPLFSYRFYVARITTQQK